LLSQRRKGKRTIRALDIGCAVGRFTFELARVVDEVIGIDNAASFIRAARALATKGSAAIQILESGDDFRSAQVRLPEGTLRGRVRFYVGDAQRLNSLVEGPFDIVAAINLLCRLPRPSAFLEQLPRLVKPGGQLVISSPFSWLPEHTPRCEWLSADELKGFLRPWFRLARACDLPFIIREHRRKYQLVVAQVLTFARKRG